MFQRIRNILLQFIVTSLLGVVSCTGDRIIESSENPSIRALTDNSTHAIVGGLSWILILILTKKPLLPNFYSVIYCVAISSFILSLKLTDATSLEKRAFLHCTTLPLLLWILLMFCSKLFGSPGINNYAWIVLTSFLSHHIRDGNRRGLWFAPIGTTRPLPYYLYIAFSMGLPYIVYWLMVIMSTPIIQDYKYQTVETV